jgi:hypothetical protein
MRDSVRLVGSNFVPQSAINQLEATAGAGELGAGIAYGVSFGFTTEGTESREAHGGPLG